MAQQNPDLESLWEEAVREYFSKTQQKPDAPKWTQSMTTQADLESLVKQQKTEFEEFRSSHKTFWNGFGKTMEQLQNIGGIAQAAVGLSPFPPAAIIVQAGLGFVRAGAEVTATYDNLEALFEKVGGIIARIDEYLKETIDKKLHELVLNLLSSLLNVFGEGQAAITRGRLKEWGRRVLKREDKVKSALEEVENLVHRETALIMAMMHSRTQRTERKLENERDRMLLRQELCAEAAADNEKFSKTIHGSRLPQSGTWILEDALYKQWFAMEFPVMWILGQPGTGKTYLASRIISEIRQNAGLVGFFYIRESMNTQHTLEVIIKAISYQITRIQDTYRERMIKSCRDDDGFSISGMTSEELFQELLLEPFSDEAAKPIFIVIDGLDEATPPNQKLMIKLAKKLSDLRCTSRKCPALQLLLLGRPGLDFTSWRRGKQLPVLLHIEPSMSKPDVDAFIESRVTTDVQLVQTLPPKKSRALKNDIIQSVSNSSDGVFMLAKLMLTEVENMNKRGLIKDALAKPPKGLDDMLQRVVARLDALSGFDKQDLNELIMWVACAKRDLLLGQLDLVLKLRDVHQDGINDLEEELKTRFGSFFSVISSEADVDEGGQEVSSVSGSEATQSSSVSDTISEGEESFDETAQDTCDTESDDSADSDGWESEEAIPRNYFTATVKFSHASVGQHFRSAPLHRGIGMDLNFAQAHLALICSQFLADNLRDRHDRPWREPNLVGYSADHFLDHFEEVDFKQLKVCHPDIYIGLSKAVVSLFRDRKSIRKWYHELTDMHKFIHQLFSKAIHTRLEACLASSSSYHKEITSSLGSNASMDRHPLKSLLEPFALYVVDAWLRLKSCDSMQAIHFLRGFLRLHDPESGKQWTLPSNRPFELIAQTISPEEIRAMASLGDMEKDRAFHHNLGSTFAKISTRQHLQSALEEFEISIQLAEDPEFTWRTRQKKANTLFELGMFDEAISSASAALKYLPESLWSYKSDKEKLLRLVSDANLHVGDRAAALKVAKEVQRSSPRSPAEAFRLIFTAHRTGAYSEITELMRPALESSDGAEFIGQILTHTTPQRYTVDYMLIACGEMGQLDLARDAFQAVKIQAQTCEDTETMAAADEALAQLYFASYRDDNEAVDLWERIVRSFPSTPSAIYASFALMPWYFAKAQIADPTEVGTWESKMERLVDAVDSMALDGYTYHSHHEVAALLAKWYTIQDKMEKARPKIRPFISDSIEQLRDEISSNDFLAYGNLSRALLCIGARRNAAISSAFTKPLRSSQQSMEDGWNMTSAPSLQLSLATNMSGNFFGRCDGGCDRVEAGFKSWSLCEVCIDTAFCDECLPKVKAGTTRLRICDPKHPHFEIWPSTGLVTKGPEGYRVRVDDDREISEDEWLAMISEKWVKT